MRKIKFTKMHGLGNDYIYINGLEEEIENPKELAVKMSNRHFGVGSDGIVLILDSEYADFKMRMFNRDGSEAEMCGNAIRCVGKYVYERGLTSKDRITIETLAGIKLLELTIFDKEVRLIKVDMGEPIIDAAQIPTTINKKSVFLHPIQLGDSEYLISCVSVGNPHCVIYVDDVDSYPVHEIGRKIEVLDIFPNRINVEFVQIINDKTAKMRVWERGAGETMACGTGATAVFAASVINGYLKNKATIKLLGGDLMFQRDEGRNNIFMSGTAQFVFEGFY